MATAIWRPHTINVVFTVEEGPRVYIERINIRGNTRTRDYVIRREFDIGEGDAYNRALIDRAERRLKNLNYFKTVKITNEPGSAPDRIVLNVDVEEMPTGEFSISGGYSTARRLDGRTQRRRAQSARPGPVRQSRGAIRPMRPRLRAVVRRALFPGLPARRSASISTPSKRWPRTTFRTTARPSAARLRAGFALSEELSFQARYNIYRQEITLPYQYNDCQFSPNALINGGPA